MRATEKLVKPEIGGLGYEVGPARSQMSVAVTLVPVVLYFYRLGQAGGAERMISRLANDLSRRGHDVHLVSLDGAESESFYPIGKSVTWHRLGFRGGIIGKFQRVRNMVKIMRRHQVRVLIGFVMSRDKTVYAAARLSGTKVAAGERNGPSMYRLRYSAVQRWLGFSLLHLCDAIAVQFPEYTHGYPRSLRKRIVSIPNSVASDIAKATPESPGGNGRFQLLTVSRLDGVQKRLDCLIRAFALVATNSPNWDLKIVGEGPHEPTLRKLVSDLGLNDRVVFEVPTANIGKIYTEANLFAIPSRWEGFPNALAEALSAGLPAVGFSGAEGVAQLITDGASGWLAGPGETTTAFAEVLAQAMSDSKERRRRGVFAIQEMSKYTPSVHNDRWFSLVDRLANGNLK